MIKKNILLVLLLAFIWIILSENFSILTAALGLAVGIGCTMIRRRYIPLTPVRGINYLKLALYPLYLAGQIYLAGFNAIKLILRGSKVEIVEIKTAIKNDFLRVTLANSITLTPGTISMDLNDDTITVLWLRDNESLPPDADIGDLIKGNLEKRIIKAER